MVVEKKDITAVIEYNAGIGAITLSIGNDICVIEAREVETAEKLLDMVGIGYQEKLGDIITEAAVMMEQYRNDKLYQLGYKAGKKFMEDKIEKHCELGKPVLANEQLFFFKTAKENLINIMDDLESAFEE